MTSSQFRPGDIVLVNLNKNNSSVIISKKRPAIIVSNNDTTRTSSLLHVVPLTTSTVKHYSPLTWNSNATTPKTSHYVNKSQLLVLLKLRLQMIGYQVMF